MACAEGPEEVELCPLTAMGNAPVGVVDLSVTFMLTLAEPPAARVTEAGVKTAVALAGRPVAPRLTVPLNPPDEVTVTVLVLPLGLDAVRLIVRLDGAADTEIAPPNATVTAIGTERVSEPLTPFMESL